MKAAFKNCPKLDIDTSVFQLSGDCSEAFFTTGITRLVINDAGITNMKDFAWHNGFGSETLQEVVINGNLIKCKDFSHAFTGNLALKKCDMSGVNFGNATSMASIFSNCQQLTTVGINYATIRNTMTNISYMFEYSGITDDIVFSTPMVHLDKFFKLCSSYTKKLAFTRDLASKMTDIN